MINPEQYYLEAFRNNLKKFRTDRGITLKELADKIGVTEATVQRYECGKGIKRVAYDRICAIADALGCEPDELTGMKKEPSPFTVGGKEALELIEKYSRLTSANQEAVSTLIDKLLEAQS